MSGHRFAPGGSGENLDRLYATSMKEAPEPGIVEPVPLAGSLFVRYRGWALDVPVGRSGEHTDRPIARDVGSVETKDPIACMASRFPAPTSRRSSTRICARG